MHWILISGLAAAAAPVLDGITVHLAEHVTETLTTRLIPKKLR